MSGRTKLLIAIPVAVVVLVVGGTWFYFNVIEGDPPAPLTFSTRDERTGSTVAGGDVSPSSLSGTWRPTGASEVGYRVDENAFGQSQTAAGRTNAITGELVLDETQVTKADFTVDMTKVSSDESRRDNQFRGRIMDTATYPTATFSLISPIRLQSIPADRQDVSYQATGDLTMHGTTKPVTFTLNARRNGAAVEVNGAIPIVFADWNIPNPSTGPISTDDKGTLEFLVVFEKA
jgi:polyisoprenoid-binding protein YceI